MPHASTLDPPLPIVLVGASETATKVQAVLGARCEARRQR